MEILRITRRVIFVFYFSGTLRQILLHTEHAKGQKSVHRLHPSTSSTANFLWIPMPVSHFLSLQTFLSPKKCSLLSFPSITQSITRAAWLCNFKAVVFSPRVKMIISKSRSWGTKHQANSSFCGFGYAKKHVKLYLKELKFKRNHEMSMNSSWLFLKQLRPADCIQM